MARRPAKALASPTPVPTLSLQALCLLVLAVVALGFVLNWLHAILIPFTLALGLNILLSPAVDALQSRLRLHRGLAVALVFVLGVAVIVGLGLLAALSVQSFFKGMQTYQAGLQDLAGRWDAWLQARQLPNSRGLLSQATASLPLVDWAKSLSGEVVDLLMGSVLTGLFLAFILGGQARQPKQGLSARVSTQVRKYLGVKLLLSCVTALMTTAILSWLGVELAVLFGLLAFFLNMIPNIGPVLAVLLPLPLVLLQYGGGSTLLLAALLPGGVQFYLGNVLEPRLLGRALGLHPVTVLLGLLVWGSLWGAAGMVLAVPLTSVSKILLERQPSLRRWARWMEGDLTGASA